MIDRVSVSRRTLLAATLAAAASGIAGCQGKTKAKGNGTVRQSMPPVPHLDPAINGSGSVSGNTLQAGLFEGLVVDNADDPSSVLPGVAEKWTISKDQLVYTFNLRANAKWSNGDPVTADDFVWNLKRGLDPATPGNNATSFTNVASMIAGAQAFFTGKATDFDTVGVKARDKSTLEITLAKPNADFLGQLTAWRMLPLHPATVQAHPNDWSQPANWVSNGPFILKDWRTNASATLVPNPNYWDKDNYHIDQWQIKFSDGGATADLLAYQANEIDIFRIEGDLASVTSDPTIAKELVSSRTNQWRCLVLMNSMNEALYDVRVRKALSLAIDRNAIASISKPDKAAFNLVPDGIEGYKEITQTKLDLDQARQLLADAGFPGGKGMPKLSLLLPQSTPWVEAVGQMWLKNLGIQTTIDLVDVGVYTQKRAAANPADYVGFSYGNFGDTPPTLHQAVTISVTQSFDTFAMPGKVLAQYLAVQANKSLDATTKAAQLQQLKSGNVFPEFQKYLDLCKKADAETDPAKQKDLLIQAGNAREESYVALPVLWGGYSYVIKPRVQGLKVVPEPEGLILRGTTIQG